MHDVRKKALALISEQENREKLSQPNEKSRSRKFAARTEARTKLIECRVHIHMCARVQGQRMRPYARLALECKSASGAVRMCVCTHGRSVLHGVMQPRERLTRTSDSMRAELMGYGVVLSTLLLSRRRRRGRHTLCTFLFWLYT